jgi:hypothetical protein
MTADHLIGIEKFEAHLWKMADQLRAASPPTNIFCPSWA